MDQCREGDTTEQAVCRQRTDEEQEAVEVSLLARAVINAGAQERRLYPWLWELK